MEKQLRKAVEEFQELYLHDNAIFLADRMFALSPSYESLFVLADAHFKKGDAETTFRLLSTYVPFTDATMALQCFDHHPSTAGQCVWRWAEKCQYLLGVACARTDRLQECHNLLRDMATEDPTGAVSYWLGVSSKLAPPQGNKAPQYFEDSIKKNPLHFHAFDLYTHMVSGRDALSAMQIGSTGLVNLARSLYSASDAHSGAPAPPRRTASSSAIPSTRGPASPTHQQQAEGGGRRSPLKDAAARSFLAPYAEALALLRGFRCPEAIQFLDENLKQESMSGWTLIQRALAAFHHGLFPQAVSYFSALLRREPWRLNEPALVHYSTALWQTKEPYELGSLAQRLISAHPLSSITLSVVGNSFSLQRDSATALTFLERATQADPSHAYAHTLRGYELLDANEKTRAEQCFRDALKHDRRQYMAIAGLGECFIRNEQYDNAVTLFRNAITINPLPTIVMKYALAMTRTRNPEPLDRPLQLINTALERHPTHYMLRSRKADLLQRLLRFDEALDVLESLRSETPAVSTIYVSLGQCCAAMRQKDRALRYFTHAVELDPSRGPLVKQLMDRL